MKKCTVIINPTSGKGLNEQLADKISGVLNDYKYEANVIITKYAGHAEEIIQNVDEGLVISVGGDGTFHEVMNGNFKRNKPLVLSHIPVGTANDIGHMYGLNSRSIVGNLKLILEGEVKTIDICSINNRDFVYVASFGKFMEIPYETPQKLKHRIGYLAYLISGVKSLFKTKQYNVTYEIDGVKHNGKYTFIIISNANHIAGINNFYNEMKLDDDCFEVMFCSIKKIRDLARAFYLLKTSDISSVSGVEIYKTNNLKITFNDNFKPWCLDGEKFDCDERSYEIKISHRAKMLIPKINIAKLFIKK